MSTNERPVRTVVVFPGLFCVISAQELLVRYAHTVGCSSRALSCCPNGAACCVF